MSKLHRLEDWLWELVDKHRKKRMQKRSRSTSFSDVRVEPTQIREVTKPAPRDELQSRRESMARPLQFALSSESVDVEDHDPMWERSYRSLLKSTSPDPDKVVKVQVQRIRPPSVPLIPSDDPYSEIVAEYNLAKYSKPFVPNSSRPLDSPADRNHPRLDERSNQSIRPLEIRKRNGDSDHGGALRR